nr:hypothetical protein [Bacilli bacterium]
VLMKKANAVLLVYDKLNSGTKFNLTDLQNELNCCKKTSIRYINDIRAHIEATRPGYTVRYEGKSKSFRISKQA